MRQKWCSYGKEKITLYLDYLQLSQPFGVVVIWLRLRISAIFQKIDRNRALLGRSRGLVPQASRATPAHDAQQEYSKSQSGPNQLLIEQPKEPTVVFTGESTLMWASNPHSIQYMYDLQR